MLDDGFKSLQMRSNCGSLWYADSLTDRRRLLTCGRSSLVKSENGRSISDFDVDVFSVDFVVESAILCDHWLRYFYMSRPKSIECLILQNVQAMFLMDKFFGQSLHKIEKLPLQCFQHFHDFVGFCL